MQTPFILYLIVLIETSNRKKEHVCNNTLDKSLIPERSNLSIRMLCCILISTDGFSKQNLCSKDTGNAIFNLIFKSHIFGTISMYLGNCI